MKFLDSFLQLIFPNICVGCNGYLSYQEKHLCVICTHSLPKFEQASDPQNAVAKIFWGRVQVHEGSAFLKFKTANLTQTVLHELKYKKNQKLGVYLGRMMAEYASKLGLFNDVDVLVPVPLHPKKEIKRGYNQSHVLCKGYAEKSQTRINNKVLRRVAETSTQTKKSRFARYKNTKDVFALQNPEDLQNKNVLLIDDVITTGATTIACIEALKKIEGIRISVYCLAYSI